MEFKISVHSMVDVITNSSTVIYTSCNDKVIESLKIALQSVLNAFGVKESVDDVFDFKLVENGALYENARLDYIHCDLGLDWGACNEMYAKLRADHSGCDWWNDLSKLRIYNPSYALKVTSKVDSPLINKAAEAFMKMFSSITAEEYDN